MATLEKDIRVSASEIFSRDTQIEPSVLLGFLPDKLFFDIIQTNLSRFLKSKAIQVNIEHGNEIIQSKGYQRLIDFIMSLSPEVHSTSIVENNTCIHIVAKKGDYTYHFDLYEDEFNNTDPEIVFNPFWGDKKLKARMDNLSEIEYLLNTNVETFA